LQNLGEAKVRLTLNVSGTGLAHANLRDGDASASIELAVCGAAKRAFVKTLSFTILAVKVSAIALLASLNHAVATVGRSIGASAGVKLAICGAAKRTAVKAFGHAGLLIQIHAVTLLTSLDDAVATHCLRIIVTATAAKRQQSARQQQHWQQPAFKSVSHYDSSCHSQTPNKRPSSRNKTPSPNRAKLHDWGEQQAFYFNDRERQ
jgi:hypothetical protein